MIEFFFACGIPTGHAGPVPTDPAFSSRRLFDSVPLSRGYANIQLTKNVARADSTEPVLRALVKAGCAIILLASVVHGRTGLDAVSEFGSG